MKEGFFMDKKIKDLLFKLVLCQGIGNLGMLKIISHYLNHGNSHLTKYEIMQIAKITTYSQTFLNSWNTLTERGETLDSFQKEHRFITILDEEYPSQLKEIYNCPAVLFYQGNLSLLKEKSLAIVGARFASNYGINVVNHFIPDLVAQGYTIVSGLAKGIDSASHLSTIKAKGNTIGIIGTGLDICYPKEMKSLQNKMIDKQLVISEYPNGTQAKKYHFPARNRIIAGLTLGTCVVEARKKSGSLITAQSALDYGREVFAVPGEIFNNYFSGCHSLIQEGAKCTVSADDIINELNYFN